MAYILIIRNKIYGCYGKVDVLRLNLMILLFHMLEENMVDGEIYETLIDYLDNENFTINSLYIEEVANYLNQLDIVVEVIVHEENGKCALEYIMNHVEYRIKNIFEIMSKDARVSVTFPGESPEKHELGPVYFDHWKLLDRDNWKTLTKTLYDYIGSKMKELQEKFNTRVRFGEVMYDNASELNYQVWSANAANWDLEEGSCIAGKYQALEMKFQEPGVYGIVVTPRYGYHDIVPPEYEDCTRPL